MSLPARIGFSLIALPLGEGVGFATMYWLVPLVEKFVLGWDSNADENRAYVALAVGAGMAFTAFLLALTLPWRRRKRRSGRMRRAIIAGVFVLIASVGFAGLGHSLLYDLAFTAWLAYLTAFTYVRYGVLDPARRVESSVKSTPADDLEE